MAGKTKKAKMGHRKAVAQNDGTTTAPTIINAGHLVRQTLDLRTACGQRRTGWTFGGPDDVTCTSCKEG